MEQSNNTKIRAIITGATGMVGEGVLHECLNHPQVEAVLIVNRKPSGFTHPKLKEIIHADFFNLDAIEADLGGYNACYFCLGVSSVGMKEPEYTRLTYDLTLHFAQTLSNVNTDVTFCYVSGANTDSTEQGKSMWARVKGKTENDLMKLPFKQVFAFRPGLMKATPGAKNTPRIYNALSWLYPFLHLLFPNSSCLLSEVGQAMINVTLYGYPAKVLEVKDIVARSVTN
jgi:uncharacterized protein YbjT (DUF2867 family)